MRHRDSFIDTVYGNRRKRFNDILDGYELGSGDFSITVKQTPAEAMRALPIDRLPLEGPEAERYWPGQWVLLEHANGGGYFATNLLNRSEVEETAARHAREGMEPECYFDLDVLAGEEPTPAENDMVSYSYEDVAYNCRIARVEEELIEGEIAYYLILVVQGGEHDRPDAGWDDYDHRVYWDDVVMVERDQPDERMPVRYSVAKVTTIVAFNTVASP